MHLKIAIALCLHEPAELVHKLEARHDDKFTLLLSKLLKLRLDPVYRLLLIDHLVGLRTFFDSFDLLCDFFKLLGNSKSFDCDFKFNRISRFLALVNCL